MAQGWAALVVDTDGNGKRDAYVEPNQAVDPQKHKRLEGGVYAIMPSPVDHSVWGTTFSMKGTIVRLDPGANPPAAALTDIYNVPGQYVGYLMRGTRSGFSSALAPFRPLTEARGSVSADEPRSFPLRRANSTTTSWICWTPEPQICRDRGNVASS